MSLAENMKLSIPERILLVEAIWDSVSNETGKNNYQLSDEQISFLNEELESYAKNPDEGASWDEIKQRILKKK